MLSFLNKRLDYTPENNFDVSKICESIGTIMMCFKITRKASDFNSLRVNCWKMNQVTSKYQMDFLNKT